MFTGIIAEFNPLHKGHEELLHFAKSEGVIIILSGNFTQRGSPAIMDKFLRAELAMKAGADLVLELPFLYACSAGQDFARGAVEILCRFGVSRLAFGMETPEFEFMPLVDVMLNEGEDYRGILHQELQRGASFTKANALALDKILPGSREFLTKPNNLLGISYILQIKRNNYSMEIKPLKRSGKFRSKDIREMLEAERKIFDMLPDYSREIILEADEQGRLCREKNLWPLLQNMFIRSKPEELRRIYGIDEGIEGLFLRNWPDSKGLDDFIGRCVCARYTRAHIRRRLIYVLLGLERWEIWGALKYKIPYVRVLAFNKRGREILRYCKKNSDIRIITRLSEAKNKTEKLFAGIEYKASGLYELLMKKPDMKRESHMVLKFP